MNKKKVGVSVVLIALFCCFASVVNAGSTVDEVRKNVGKLVTDARSSVTQISAKEFKAIMDRGEKYVLIDVRTESEYEAAHLPGATNISRGLIEFVTPKQITNTDTRIYVYCRTGARAALAVKRLVEMGYKNAVNISDSFKGWVEAGYPVYNRHGEFVLTPGGFEKKEK